jgi:type I restriction enzyme, S subunit
MSFPKYEVYKDSGIEWVDLLPSHWSIVSLKWISDIFAGGTPDKKNLDFWTDGSIPWLNSGSVNQGLITEVSDLITADAYRCSSAKWIPKDALVIALAGQGKTKGMTAQLAIEATCNQSMAAIVLNDKASARYVYWWLTNNYQNIRNLAGGDLRDGLNLEMIGAIHTPIPTKLEQKQIANFLDRETTRIDALIAEQQRLIELLKEKRQAVISHAVTKGIDRTVPMKDSGVEWLGKVPEHWQVSKLGHYAEILTGFAFPSAAFSHDESDTKLLRGANVGISTLRWEDTVYWKLEQDDELSKYLMPIGQVVMGMDRPWIGEGMRLARVSGDDVPCLLLQRVAAITPNSSLSEDYLFNLLWSDLFKHYVEPDLTGVSVPHISPEQILNFQIPFPPIQEQQIISEYINAEISKVSSLIEQSNVSVRLLQERRSALISAAVTGKIDVRNWKPSPEPTPTYGRQ